jgi:hypothetical protein
MKNITKPVWAVVDIFGEKLQAVRPTRALAREWNHEHNYGLGSIVKYIPAPVTPKAKPAPKAVPVLTDWIGVETPPVFVGVFEVTVPMSGDDDDKWFSFWNGCRWGSRELSVSDAFDNRTSPALGPVTSYRGFTTKQQ